MFTRHSRRPFTPAQQGRYHVYQAAKAPTKATFDHHMKAVSKLNPKAADKLNETPHDTWANYACRDNVIWDQTTSNISESVNAMIGKEVIAHAVLCSTAFPRGRFGMCTDKS